MLMICGIIITVIMEASGHSWVINLVGDIKAGLPRIGMTTHQHPDQYYARPMCPLSTLDQCMGLPPPYKPLDESSLRPCRRAGSSGATNMQQRAEVTRGSKLHVSWMGNGHTNSVSDGTCIVFKMAPYNEDPSWEDFSVLEECLPFYQKNVSKDSTSADITIPADTAPGLYTVLYMWSKFDGVYYATCSDIVVH
ncbi:hypothetical protein Pmar_PMAR011619 [Perkinsus marinus ATCC 50983]|uniref:Chitin-binding type-4 domain-containing protein n=1 Tax=Perkinsus marinus (strain ATCC 50983 / TXsc) TaxID=423536 RepID=C5LCA5_PERM5|nr:hypothetical protein Pmar_PMAR011619 [Perkinsus marinus ATCC 50983]EER05588.1 hypothetical protein Pmar_PMAR011619 [Perkinsus marinus ATCC 50983]|eukprot:XP_002773772.1 hypothetical protein Pmar_PMAR011619 [Perkinsus marinus ATCC 50983]